ncbi:MAG: glycoside hydrolase family 92 protein [Chitinophagaceae bacterium]|nr:MAG: glycoside hydrolase family 92 protein [Chitinophagaceae bacterium]
MRKILIALIFIAQATFAQVAIKKDLVQYVNPMIGTRDMGHTYPGATVPFGMVQLSPDTDTIPYAVNGKYNPEVYRYCAGYQYDDKTIVGFSHTHFNGTGHSDLGDFLIMPTVGKLKLNPGTADRPESGFRSRFSHSTEVAAPDYYKVKLDDYDIMAELTATARVGFHQYTFPASDQAHIILDMMSGVYNYPDKNVWVYVRVVNDTLVTGYRQTEGWARNRVLYFAMVFNKPFTSYGMHNFSRTEPYHGFWGKFDQEHDFPVMAGRQIRTYFNFKTRAGEKLKIKFALSPVSMKGALNNLHHEIPGWDFDAVKERGQEEWNKELHRIEIQSDSRLEKENFYTAMYHAFINPTVYMDADHLYKGLDKEIHRADHFTNYTTFSLWDTFRALHPLFNIIQVRRNEDMIKSMLAHYRQSAFHMLPVWSNSANENWCMIGYHAVSVIADAIIKDKVDFDANKALEACVTTADNRWYGDLGYYIDKGYVPEDKSSSSVSQTLEYAYDDWCIAQLAKKLHRMDVYDRFTKRSQSYKNLYDLSTGFMRPEMSDGTWMKNFDPLETNEPGFVEGNSWNYSLFVPQDPKALIGMMGGNKRFIARLDSLFTMQLPDKYFAHTEDISREGIIGNYVHGNEPSHHIAYLYDWTNEPWKAQKWIRLILKNQYHAKPDGLGGNDDTGQMSAWYIFSTLGFYPVAPASDQYAIGSPAIKSAVMHLENGKTFTIQVKNQSDKDIYVKKIILNDRPLHHYFLSHQDIINGGRIIFIMSDNPNKQL